MFQICCLMTSGISLSADMCESLFQTAVEMVSRKLKRLPLKMEDAEGEVATEFKTASLGPQMNGYIFEALIESNRGKGKVRFIVPEKNLEEAVQQEQERVWVELGSLGSAQKRSANAWMN